MGRARRNTRTVLCAALLVSVGALWGVAARAGIAGAEENAAVATLGGTVHGDVIEVRDGDGYELTAGTQALTLNGQELQVYCVDLHHGTVEGASYAETGWSNSTLSDNHEAGKIAWILSHSYPHLDVENLAQETGIDGLNPDTAAAATQAAIWRFSDQVDATPRDEAAAQLTEWLTSHAVAVDEPRPTLQLSSSSVAGKSGEKIGPITVTTSATSVELRVSGAPDGARIVNAQGQPVTSAHNGEEVFFSVPTGAAPGSARLTATALSAPSLGRVFKAVDGTSQTLILAGSAAVPVTAEATVEWAGASNDVIPAANAEERCDKEGVLVTLENSGDESWSTQVGGQHAVVDAGGSTDVLVKVRDGDTYDIEVAGPGGFSKRFEGALKCTSSTFQPKAPGAEPGPKGSTGTGVLAQTGGGSASVLLALVGSAAILGGSLLLVVRHRVFRTPGAGRSERTPRH
ncbi:thioester domain-containing protein [Streptomyces sp. M41]|uniref:thioester domain-containing protein n=1 Tax=Streptomyces sp. M41 TaxID=3059412 RepID=UPI00374C8A5C